MDRSRRGSDADVGTFSRLSGVWRSHGYGTLLEIGPDRYRLYEETRVSCVFVYEGTLEELADFYVEVRVSAGGRAFSARRSTGVTRVKYRRLAALPRPCARSPEGKGFLVPDPVRSFEIFWHTFAERYALFGIRGVDWQAVHDRYRPRIGAGTGPRELFATFVEMLRPLRDGHVALHGAGSHFNAGGPSPLQRRLAKELGKSPEDDAVLALMAERRDRLRDVIRRHYLGAGAGARVQDGAGAGPAAATGASAGAGPRVRRGGNGLLEWGRLDAATGYLALRAMAGQSGRANRPREDQEAAAAAMDRVVADLGALPALVVDVRDNGGGYDGVSLRIAGYLIDRKRLAFTKSASKGEGFGARQSIFIEPRGAERYTGRIFLLTSGLTASAAEIFVLALLRHPRVTRIGEPTRGELSDVMERHLPNGWRVTLSNELYRASDGELYEDRGISPHVELPFPHRRDVAAGRDPMLDHVLATVRGSG